MQLLHCENTSGSEAQERTESAPRRLLPPPCRLRETALAPLHALPCTPSQAPTGLTCMQWKKSTPSPLPRRQTLQKGQW